MNRVHLLGDLSRVHGTWRFWKTVLYSRQCFHDSELIVNIPFAVQLEVAVRIIRIQPFRICTIPYESSPIEQFSFSFLSEI